MESLEKDLKKIIECLRTHNYTKSQILPTEKLLETTIRTAKSFESFVLEKECVI